MQSGYTVQQSYTSQSRTTNNAGNAVLINSGLTDREGAKNVARRILDTYDRDRNGVIDSIEVVPMIVDAYKSFNRVFSPSRADIESYIKVLDRNGDGKVTLQDLEDLCSKYLTSKIWPNWSSNIYIPLLANCREHGADWQIIGIDGLYEILDELTGIIIKNVDRSPQLKKCGNVHDQYLCLDLAQ